MSTTQPLQEFEISPDPDDPRLSHSVAGIDHYGNSIDTQVIIERPLTLYLNSQEIVTMMTIGDQPEMLAVGYFHNQNMLKSNDEITGIDYDDDLEVVVVRTKIETNFEEKLKKKTRTSGCAQGTIFGDVMESFAEKELATKAILKTSWLYAIMKKINTHPSLYLKAGAIHGCALCFEDKPLVYMEDVGRHNAVDKIAGYMFLNNIPADDKFFYTTGRLTSEMVIKCVHMGIPILASRSGFTAWGVDLAKQANLTLIGRARGKRFIVLAGQHRLEYDVDVSSIGDESRKHQRKGAKEDMTS